MSSSDSLKGIVLSDMHLFSSRSDGFARMKSIYPEMRKADICVFNGDVFDFRWTILSSLEETVEKAETWLAELLAAYPDCVFLYTYGNHDSHPLFLERLKSVASKYSNLHLFPSHVVLGDTLFVHGDIVDASASDLEGLESYRERFAYTEKQGFLKTFLFAFVIRFSLHRIFISLHDRSKYCEKLFTYLRKQLGDRLSSIRRVFFGHVHSPFQDYQHEGIAFTNTGSMIQGLEYLVGVFEASREDLEDALSSH